MKINRYLFLLPVILMFFINVNAQTVSSSDLQFAQEKLNERGEVFFSFKCNDKNLLSQLTRIVSIDKLDNTRIYAYANSDEFEQFLSYQIPFTPVYDYYNTPKALTMATDAGQMVNWDRYPTHAVYEEIMQNFVTNYPTLCQLDTIGYSVNGWPILNLTISDNIGTDED
ncbi:MAG: hypothetical protein C0594_06580 [Marinilabiliales bacterium]|nr:MAG: hypothetical protein C0594_06580 [Marinilabiliales bacterium]